MSRLPSSQSPGVILVTPLVKSWKAAIRTRTSSLHRPRLKSQSPAHGLDEGLGKRQTEAGALDSTRFGVEAVEGGEEPFAQLRCDAEAGVGDGESRAVLLHGAVKRHAALASVYLIALDNRFKITALV